MWFLCGRWPDSPHLWHSHWRRGDLLDAVFQNRLTFFLSNTQPFTGFDSEASTFNVMPWYWKEVVSVGVRVEELFSSTRTPNYANTAHTATRQGSLFQPMFVCTLWWCRPHPVREHAQDLRPPLGARPASPPTCQAAQPPPRGLSTNPRPLV